MTCLSRTREYEVWLSTGATRAASFTPQDAALSFAILARQARKQNQLVVNPYLLAGYGCLIPKMLPPGRSEDGPFGECAGVLLVAQSRLPPVSQEPHSSNCPSNQIATIFHFSLCPFRYDPLCKVIVSDSWEHVPLLVPVQGIMKCPPSLTASFHLHLSYIINQKQRRTWRGFPATK